MTTTVVDRKNRLLTSDSRWSAEIPGTKLLAFVDDTGFDKIADRGHASLICAGDGQLIEQWKTWFSTPILNIANLPAVDRVERGQNLSISLSIWLKPSCTHAFSSGWHLSHEDDAHFSGSGALHAKGCYALNGCARRAVSSAGKEDPATGGNTMYVDFVSGVHNLNAGTVTQSDVLRQLNDRGMVMDIETRKMSSIQEFAAKGPDILRAIANGEIALSAPTGLPAKPWTAAEKEELRKALQNIADLEAADRR